MKTDGILGILWLIYGCCCAYANINHIILVMPAHFDSKLYHYVWWHGSVLLLNLVIIMASLFLTRGATWARWFIGMFATVFFIIFIGLIGISFSVWNVICGLFGLISAILLLKPRQHEAA